MFPQIWVLRRWDHHSDEVTLWADADSALGGLAAHTRENWATISGQDHIPEQPPAHDREAVDLYYNIHSKRWEEGYTIYPAEVGGPCLASPPGFPLPGQKDH